MDAGHCVLIAPSTVFLMACRLAGPGAIAKSLGRAINVGIVNDSASRGTSSRVANAPSFTCWFRHTSSSSTTFTACLLYTSDAADERSSVDLGGRRIIKKK